MLIPHILHAVRARDSRYTLDVAGTMTDLRTQRYLLHLFNHLGLARAVRFHGTVADMPGWYADKGVLLSTTMYESFGLNIAEAMAVGAYPVVHDFPGADRLWPHECLYAGIDNAVRLILGAEPMRYRSWIARRYDLRSQAAAILAMLRSLDLRIRFRDGVAGGPALV
jgi:glycosyltransferase involved in cell wall biosynthesis